MLDKIKIGWKEYDVVEKDIDDSLIEVSATRYGEIDYHEQVININNDATKECKIGTLIHEVLHGTENMYGIELGEEKVDRLGNALYTVLKDNNLEIVKK